MFSGGVDSTAMLVKLLAGSDEPLRVHHIHMANQERRDAAERRAVEAILAYCRKHYRPFRAFRLRQLNRAFDGRSVPANHCLVW